MRRGDAQSRGARVSSILPGGSSMEHSIVQIIVILMIVALALLFVIQRRSRDRIRERLLHRSSRRSHRSHTHHHHP
ncbi:hypothetical protein [Burkholderia ubonensis]|uniref:hypothetical protein n=2 Tax=Burkholderiaceae TaxID=119060 RepID=UPI00075AC82C|nr:hypothetical protein [Burkholderia ubonensis]KVP37921.1 hypothetical protein WJ88_02930 [Burkholderia ubonensis]KVQ81929.1 hypothetical protein WK06_12475 [Burkholderia ubonensis]KVW25277.1 hypothetical protein WK93_16715 [Burkholderia ubonensis]KWB56301.1 hypothetical protein WL37_31010 [Burkholderia ubonensis]KWB82625.1 hypothetical protein WL42_07710 [Burkholderia ubonensis]